MSTVAALFVATGVIALVDWFAVGTGRRTLEYVAKPLTMVPLIAAAVVMDPVDSAMRWWFVLALVMSLVGDVFLMLPNEELFVFGLGAFLVGHIGFIVGLAVGGVSAVGVALGLVVVGLALGAVAPRIVTGARRTDPRLGAPVALYVTVISVMVVCAIGSVVPAAIAGALLFYASDCSIGWSRFVQDFGASRLVIITTYHAAQVLLTLSLLSSR